MNIKKFDDFIKECIHSDKNTIKPIRDNKNLEKYAQNIGLDLVKKNPAKIIYCINL